MRVLVTGGRDFNLPDEVHRILYAVHTTSPITLLGHGDAEGADRLCKLWALRFDIEVRDYEATKAEWEIWGSRAGNMRNSRMLREFRPDAAVSFPGGSGTRDMRVKLLQAGVPTFVGFYTDTNKDQLRWKFYKGS
jgi:hypothetical protein